MAIRIYKDRIMVSRCTEGVYLRWWFNGWHYFNFTNGYEIEMQTASMDIQVTNFFSVISKIERDTRITSEYRYKISLHGIRADDIAGFTGLLLAEKAEQYEDGVWREVEITRGEHLIKEEGTNGYIFEFEIRRKELPNSSSVYQKTLKLYLGDTLCDMDDSEIVPINKQVNDIAQMQDRNTDFTAGFKIRKTRAMRALFELSGEVGDNTTFPYERQYCKLIQDNIEVITNGILVLNRVDEQYYHVSVMSGNISFFKAIETLSITDLTLAGMDHTWDETDVVDSHAVVSPPADFVYPLCEPSDDGGVTPPTDTGDRVDIHIRLLRPFLKVKTIWEEIFSNAGYTVTGGEVLSHPVFDRLYMPISSLKTTDTTKYLYSVYWGGAYPMTVNEVLGFPGAIVTKGDANFGLGYYTAPYTARYTFRVQVIGGLPTLYLTEGVLHTIVATFETTAVMLLGAGGTYEVEYDATAGDLLSIVTTPLYYTMYMVSVVKIDDAKIGYGSTVTAHLYLPNIKQTDFIKMVCHLFGLVPEVNDRDHEVRFWNYQELYDNIPLARDWSNYLSERDDTVEFKFGDYGRENYLKYKQSDDVIIDNGKGVLPVEDETLQEEKDIVQLALATADEVRILDNVFAVDVARINFNKWSESDGDYEPNDSIDPRIVYIDRVKSVASPPYEKTLGIIYDDPIYGETIIDVDSPLKASTLEISFSSLIGYYANLSRMLTKTKMRRMKFNMPVYEIAGLKHNIPVYLRQYKAYFYVNKINNYVAGKLCNIDLIKL